MDRSPESRIPFALGFRKLLLVSAVALFVLAACAQDHARVAPVEWGTESIPRPELGRVDPAVAQQLSTERDRLDRLLAESTAGTDRSRDSELAEALGRMGQLYHAYDLLVPAAACYSRAHQMAKEDFRWLYYLGVVAQREGHFDEAARFLERALESKDRSRSQEPSESRSAERAATLLRLGNVELARAKPQEASRHFEHALEADRRCVEARFGLGQAAAALGDPETAVGHFRATLEQQPGAARVHYPLAQALLRLGRREEAESELAASASRAVSVGGRASCPDPLDAELGELTTGVTAMLARGRHAEFAGDLDRELAEYRKAVAAAPDDAVVRQSLGSALFRRGDMEAAAEQYRQAAKLDADNAGYRYDLGLCLTQLGQLSEAANLFRSAVAMDPTLFPAHVQLAESELRAGRLQETLGHAQKALAIEPGHRQARLLQSMALLGLGRREEAARELAELMADHPPEDPAERLQLAGVLLSLGKVTDSEPHFEALVGSGIPDGIRARSFLLLGQIDLLRSQPEKALGRFRAAVEADPDLPEARAALEQALQASRP